MQKLSRILSPDFNPRDLIAVAPEWRRADFKRAVFYLSGRLKAQGVQAAALWFDDAALFASDDYGETWTRFDAPFSCGGNQSGRGCGERMCVNPNNNKEVWFGSRDSGLWKTCG